jgi:1-phosphatidylinositol-4-phosphate 5-kinase
MIDSNKEEEVKLMPNYSKIFYHIAIIDYLQEWNVNKEVERAAKKLINFNSNLDTSA